MKTRERKIPFKSLLITSTILALLSWTVHHPLFHRRLASFVKTTTHWEILFEKSRLKLLLGSFELHGLELRNPQGKTVFTAEHLRFHVSPLSAIRGKILITQLHLDHPQIFLSQQSSNETKEFSPEMIKRFFEYFEKSLLLQNINFQDILLRNLSLHTAAGDTRELGTVSLHLSTNLLQEINMGARMESLPEGFPPQSSFEIDLTAKRNHVTIEKFILSSPKISLNIKGDWKGDPLTGLLTVSGKLEAPTVLSFPLNFQCEAQLDHQIAHIKKLTASLEEGRLDATGTYHLLEKKYHLTFKAKDFSLASIFRKIPSPIVGPAQGFAEVDGLAEGTLPSLKAEAHATIHNFRHGPLQADQASGKISFSWPELDFVAGVQPKLTSSEGVAPIKVAGGVIFKHLQGIKNIQAVLKILRLDANGASIADIIPSLKTTGLIKGELSLEGAEGTSAKGKGHAVLTQGKSALLGDIESLETNLTLEPGGITFFSNTQAQLGTFSSFNWPGTLRLETSPEEAENQVLFGGELSPGLIIQGRYFKDSKIFEVHSLNIKKEGATLQGKGQVDLNTTPSKIEANLQGVFNLQWVRFLPQFFKEGDGLAKVNVTCEGTSEKPVLHGKIEFNQSALTLRKPSFEVTRLTGFIDIEDTTLQPHLSGKLDESDFQLEGHLKMAQGNPQEFNLHFKGSHLNIIRPSAYQLEINSDVFLTGHAPSPLLKGNVDIVDGRYTKQFIIRDLVLKPSESKEESRPWEKTIENVQLDLHIQNTGDLKIQNNVGSIFLQSELHVLGTYAAPRIAGSLTAIEGTAFLLGEKFDLNEGRLEFLDPSRQDPYLTLSAKKDIPISQELTYTVSVNVKGYLSNLEVSLSSDPVLSKEDIVSLIAFGVPPSQLRDSSLSIRSLGTNILAEEISTALQQPISRSVGLDTFKVEASKKGSPSKVDVGKNVTDRLSLEFINDLAPETAERTFQANYYLTDNILLKGFRTHVSGTDPRYQFNVSFRFRLR